MYWNKLESKIFITLERLIETWDVLKFAFSEACCNLCSGLIETWDVLKYV